MPPYRSPEKGASYEFPLRFIRVGPNIFVTAPNDRDTHHDILARKDGIWEEVLRLRLKDRRQVDAGFLFVGENNISVYFDSTRLAITEDEEARRITVKELQKQSPHHRVVSS